MSPHLESGEPLRCSWARALCYRCLRSLRNGTHFVSSAIELDASDAGLTIQAFPGEQPWLSRGVPLTGLTWLPVNSSGPTGWQGPFNNSNAVYDQPPGTFEFGLTPDNATCAAACKANFSAGGPCTIWTWHAPGTGSYENQW